MAVSFSSPRFNAEDNAGRPLVGGRLFIYLNKTTSPAVTYADSAATAPNTNPIILDARGEAVIFVTQTQKYTFVLQDRNGALIWSQDDVTWGEGVSQAELEGPGGTELVGFQQLGEGAVARTAQDKLRETVSAADYGFSITNDASSNAGAIVMAIRAAGPFRPVLIQADSDYQCSHIEVPIHNAYLQFKGSGQLLASGSVLNYRNEYEQIRTVTNISDETIAVMGSGLVRTKALTVSSSDGYSKGDIVKIMSDEEDIYTEPGTRRMRGEFSLVIAAIGNVVHIQRDLDDAYDVTRSCRLAKLPRNGIRIEGLKIKSTIENTSSLLQLNAAYCPYVEFEVNTHGRICMNSIGSYRGTFENVQVTDLNTANGALGYGINDVSGYYNIIRNIVGKFARHVTTTNFNAAPENREPEYYGGCRGHRVYDGFAEGCQGASFDAHPGSRDDLWTDCQSHINLYTSFSNNVAFQPRGVNGTIVRGECGGEHEAMIRITSQFRGHLTVIDPIVRHGTRFIIPQAQAGLPDSTRTPVDVRGGIINADNVQSLIELDRVAIKFEGTRFLLTNVSRASVNVFDLVNARLDLDDVYVAVDGVGVSGRLVRLRAGSGRCDVRGKMRLETRGGYSFARILVTDATAETNTVFLKVQAEVGPTPSLNAMGDGVANTRWKAVTINTEAGSTETNVTDYTDYMQSLAVL